MRLNPDLRGEIFGFDVVDMRAYNYYINLVWKHYFWRCHPSLYYEV